MLESTLGTTFNKLSQQWSFFWSTLHSSLSRFLLLNSSSLSCAFLFTCFRNSSTSSSISSILLLLHSISISLLSSSLFVSTKKIKNPSFGFLSSLSKSNLFTNWYQVELGNWKELQWFETYVTFCYQILLMHSINKSLSKKAGVLSSFFSQIWSFVFNYWNLEANIHI